jgi:hypothetical protein
VLINRSHAFTDLICPIDAFENRLHGAIDGNRTVGEILQLADPRGDRKAEAASFFERMWRYDQIIIDASGAAIGQPARDASRTGEAARLATPRDEEQPGDAP